MGAKHYLFGIGMAIGLQASAMAGFVEGATAYNARNYAVALREIAPLAKASNHDAEQLLGLMYYMGRGVTRDYKQAFFWSQKAAAAGKADAEYLIGAMYYTGNSVPLDQRQAVMWFHKAAEQGHADAQHALALMYRYHVAGVPQDVVIAYMLWNLSAAGGNASAPAQRASVARQMTQEQVDEAQALSRAWKVGTALPEKSKTGGE
jgi:TPR repeat protein